MELASLPPWRLRLGSPSRRCCATRRAATAALSALRVTGIRLALDDFGTGFSRTGLVAAAHALKIDGSFVDGLRHRNADPVDRSIVEALIRMAHALDLEITAEWWNWQSKWSS